MSFDVFLQRFENGEVADVQREPVLDVVRKHTFRGPNEFGFYIIEFPDGVEVEFCAEGLELEERFTGCAFFIRGFGKHLADFIYQVARAGDMLIIPMMEGSPLVFVSENQRTHVSADFLERARPVVVKSPEELGALLTGGFDGWSAYRDQVVRKQARR